MRRTVSIVTWREIVLAIAVSDRLVECARAQLGTPFCKGGRAPGVGLDCGGLILVCARQAGLQVTVPERWDLGGFLEFSNRHLYEIDLPSPGSVLQFRRSETEFHLGLCSGPDAMVHAWDGVAIKSVRETPIRPWVRLLVACYKFREEKTPWLH